MKLEFKMFNFQGSPVYFKLWFLLLFAWLTPSMVIAIFLSVLVHELAHAFIANSLGYNVRQIYIDLFYGAAEIDLDHCPERDSDCGRWTNKQLTIRYTFLWNICHYWNSFLCRNDFSKYSFIYIQHTSYLSNGWRKNT